jgi:polar amino acid transport system substrate-binding protein
MPINIRTNDSLNYTRVSDLKGYKIGVYGPSNTSKKLESLQEKSGGAFTIDLRPDDESGFKKLSLGRVTAVFSNKDAGFALIKKIKLDNLRYAGKQSNLNYFIGFSKKYNDKAVVDRFNATVKELQRDGVIKEILSRTFMMPSD